MGLLSFRSAPTEVDEVVRPHLFLRPGEHIVAASPTEVATVLGSCVAVCLWNPVRGHGAVNHFLLPLGGDGAGGAAWRYGDTAVDLLVGRMLELGARRGELVAKVFGGAHLLSAGTNGTPRLGSRNAEIALARLAGHQVQVEAQAILGRFGRKLVFHTDTGAAWVKTLGTESGDE
ncbi:MAG TPA: chemotaxis protein CheD [Acidobacteria bacterium]|nr:chemotaxis protein CheD [Acidobacteriota bacterium]